MTAMCQHTHTHTRTHPYPIHSGSQTFASQTTARSGEPLQAQRPIPGACPTALTGSAGEVCVPGTTRTTRCPLASEFTSAARGGVGRDNRARKACQGQRERARRVSRARRRQRCTHLAQPCRPHLARVDALDVPVRLRNGARGGGGGGGRWPSVCCHQSTEGRRVDHPAACQMVRQRCSRAMPVGDSGKRSTQRTNEDVCAGCASCTEWSSSQPTDA